MQDGGSRMIRDQRRSLRDVYHADSPTCLAGCMIDKVPVAATIG